jgi:hypothetical protein
MVKRPAPDRERGRQEREPEAQLSVVLPASIVRAVKIRAAERGETVRAIVLHALKADGFKIPNREITDRRAEANRRRGRSKPRTR